MEEADLLIVFCHRALTLEDSDIDCGLVICSSREDLRLTCRNGGIGLNEFGHHAAESLDSE